MPAKLGFSFAAAVRGGNALGGNVSYCLGRLSSFYLSTQSRTCLSRLESRAILAQATRDSPSPRSAGRQLGWQSEISLNYVVPKRLKI